MERRRVIVAATTLILLLGPAVARAGSNLAYSGAGMRLGYVSPDEGNATALVGAHAEFAEAGSRVQVVPGVQYFNADGFSDLNVNGDVDYRFATTGRVTPYAGAGLGLHALDGASGDSGTHLGANVFGGLKFPGAGSRFFVESRLAMSQVTEFALMGGVTFNAR